MNILDTKIQYYPANIEYTEPLGTVTVREFIYSHKNPKESVVELFKSISDASARGDKKLKDILKRKLFYFTPSVITNGGRKYSDIVLYNPIIQLDFDGISNALELKEYLFENYEFIICAYLSPSRLGVKCLARIPQCYSIEEMKEYIYGLYSHLEKYTGFDPAPKNIALALYLSHDKDLKYRENPTVWDRKGGQYNDPSKVIIDPNFESTDELSEEGIRSLANHIKNMIGRADIEQVGHKFVVNTSSVFGGICAHYKNLDADRMLDYLYTLIEESDYLSKNIYGYKKTAQEMFKRGATKPLEYKPKKT